VTIHRIEYRRASHAHAGALIPTSFAAPETVWLAGRVALCIAIACLFVAVAVHTWFAAAARRSLAYPFTGIPPRFAEAASIFANNLRVAAALAGLLLIAQSARCNAPSAEPGPIHTTIQRFGEALLGTVFAVNVIVIGVSFGAYGMRMLRAAMPHGPVELAAYSLSLAVYLRGRRRRLPVGHILAYEALCVVLLALAAALETFVTV
jgi:hypothetical protein